MPAEKITIKELADRAMIHRKTFYLHYTSIEALYQDMMAEIADGTYEEMGKIKPPYSHKEVNRISSLITLSRINMWNGSSVNRAIVLFATNFTPPLYNTI